MENKLEKAVDDFIDVPETEEEKEFSKKVNEQKKKFIKSDFAIIERVDRIVVTDDGRQLLREVY